MDLISVIVPVYKVEKYLDRCINSIINQTYQNLEIILVDDGSPDNSGVMCDEYAVKDSRIKVIHKKNGGLSDARNAGIEVAAGKYITFLDSDDYIHENMISLLYDRIIQDGSDIALCNAQYVDEYGNFIENKLRFIDDCILSAHDAIENLVSGASTLIVSWAKLYKREIFSGLRFPIGKIHEDEFIVHKLLKDGIVISCLKYRLYYYVQREGSIINSKYTVRNLDLIEALLDRVNHFFDIKENEFAIKTLNSAIYAYDIRIKEIKYDAVVKNRKREIHSLFRGVLFKHFNTIFNNRSVKQKILTFLFLSSPDFYHFIICSYKKLRRKN